MPTNPTEQRAFTPELSEVVRVIEVSIWNLKLYRRGNNWLLACLLALLAAGCAMTSPPRFEPKAGLQVKSRESEITIITDGRTHYFQNQHPHCLAYILNGEWDFALQKAALRNESGRFVGVALHDPEAFTEDPHIPRPPSSDQVAYQLTRVIAYYKVDTEKDWSQPIPIDVSPFPAALPGALLVRFGKVVVTPDVAARIPGPVRPKVGEVGKLPDRVFFPSLPGIIMVITADAADARQVLDTLQLTEHPQCWYLTIRERFPSIRLGLDTGGQEHPAKWRP